eukprot:6477403-Amphidinium_carterae.1
MVRAKRQGFPEQKMPGPDPWTFMGLVFLNSILGRGAGLKLCQQHVCEVHARQIRNAWTAETRAWHHLHHQIMREHQGLYAQESAWDAVDNILGNFTL